MENLDNLERQAAMVDQDAAELSPEAIAAKSEQAAVIGQTEQNAAFVGMAFSMVTPVLFTIYPSLQKVLTGDAIEQLAGVYGPLMTKYEFNGSDAFSKYKEEIAALAVTFTIGSAALVAIREDAAVMRVIKNTEAPKDAILEHEKPEELPEPDKSDSKTVTFG